MLGFMNWLKGNQKYKPNDGEHLDVSKASIHDQWKIRKGFHEATNKNVSDDDVPAVAQYLASSKPVDDHYRGISTTPEAADHAKRLEGIIKKTRTPQKLIMYRGFQSEDNIKPGTVINHHGITSYGGSRSYADNYHDPDATNHLIKLRVPEGTHAAYIEHISQQRKHKHSPKQMDSHFNHGGEQNWILHPQTKVRVVSSNWNKRRKRWEHEAELIHDGASENKS